MLIEKPAINEITRNNIKNLIKPYFGRPKQEGLQGVISEILYDKDLFVYMATHSIKDSGIILGRMEYFDDISIVVPYGIAYNFNNPSLNIFTFESCKLLGDAEKPIKTLRLSEVLPSKKSMGIGTEEHYSNYPNVDEFTNSLNRILQMGIKEQKPFWVDFNKPFYG